MTNSPNPEKLLRRPKKPQAPQPSGGGKMWLGVGGGAAVVAGIVAFVIVNHGKTAASVTPKAAATVAVAPVVADVKAQSAPHVAKTAPAQKFAAGASPSPLPAPSATPQPSPTPIDTRGKTAAEIAHARHELALQLATQRLAALRRAQAVQAATPLAALGTQGSRPASQPTTQSVAAAAPPSPTATPDAEATPVYAPRVVVDARFIDRVAPAYPEMAREQGASGTAIVLATIGPQGSVVSVEIEQSTGNKLLDSAALSAARSSRFQPPEIDGKPATETYRIVYTFDPNQ